MPWTHGGGGGIGIIGFMKKAVITIKTQFEEKVISFQLGKVLPIYI